MKPSFSCCSVLCFFCRAGGRSLNRPGRGCHGTASSHRTLAAAEQASDRQLDHPSLHRSAAINTAFPPRSPGRRIRCRIWISRASSSSNTRCKPLFARPDRRPCRAYLQRLEYRVRFYRFFFLAPLYVALPFFFAQPPRASIFVGGLHCCCSRWASISILSSKSTIWERSRACLFWSASPDCERLKPTQRV